MLVHKGNPVPGLTTAQVAGILSGEITDWSQVSAQAGRIHLHLPKESGALLTEVRGALARGFPKLAMSKATGEVRYAAGRDWVSASPAIRWDWESPRCAIPASLAPSRGGRGRNRPARSDGVHRRHGRLRLFPAHRALPRRRAEESETLRFIEYALSPEAQRLVGDAGFVDLNLRPEVRELPAVYRALIPPELRDRLRQTEQLPVNFRFARNSAELDFAARDALDRVVKLISHPEMRARSVLLFGFTDGAGTDEYNFKLSNQRAQAIGALFAEHGIHAVHPVGLGKQLPVASNDTPAGMAQNRRVEIWVAEVK